MQWKQNLTNSDLKEMKTIRNYLNMQKPSYSKMCNTAQCIHPTSILPYALKFKTFNHWKKKLSNKILLWDKDNGFRTFTNN
jgi:hypothetical protein